MADESGRDAYEVGLALAIPDGLGAGLALMLDDLATTERAIAQSLVEGPAAIERLGEFGRASAAHLAPRRGSAAGDAARDVPSVGSGEPGLLPSAVRSEEGGVVRAGFAGGNPVGGATGGRVGFSVLSHAVGAARFAFRGIMGRSAAAVAPIVETARVGDAGSGLEPPMGEMAMRGLRGSGMGPSLLDGGLADKAGTSLAADFRTVSSAPVTRADIRQSGIFDDAADGDGDPGFWPNADDRPIAGLAARGGSGAQGGQRASHLGGALLIAGRSRGSGGRGEGRHARQSMSISRDLDGHSETMVGRPAVAPQPDRGGGGDSGVGPVTLDGRLVGQWLSERMAREASRPGAGATFFDPRQGPAWTPSGAL